MRIPGWTNISLAAKCRILFGVAVLSILAATLYLPWVYMVSLSDTSEVRRAEQAAVAARLTANVDSQDLASAQSQLERDWPATAPVVDFLGQAPELISVDKEPLLKATRPHGFLYESFRTLREDPNRRLVYKFQSDETSRWLRLAMAIRTAATDPEPNALRGIIHVRMPIQNENRFWSSMVLVFAGLSGGLLAMLVFYLVTQRLILSPVRHLRRVAEQVTHGDIDVRASVATGDEFEQLGNALNDMLAHLQQSHDELRTINRSLDVRLGELAETNVALYEANRLKSEFIANVSHELRTPLGLIINFAELLRDALDDPPSDLSRLIRYATNILQSGRSLLDFINDLLDLAKIEAGKVELNLTEFSLIDTCEALIEFVLPLAEKKKIQLNGPKINELPKLHSDAGRVRQILYNLLSNAVKFTPEGGVVSLDVGRADDAR
ncbi:MAG: HAMP domain-containing protein, partial [Planctomycetes bacterium]|nr:HAMP domain-containing protein [Planctomycetota bacterium]